MNIRTIQFNGVTFGFHDDEDAAAFASCFDTLEKAQALGAALERRQAGDCFGGLCPHCFKNDGYVNAGRTHVFYCDEHKVSWVAGANLTDSWKHETEEQQRRIYDDAIGGYERIGNPFFWPMTIDVIFALNQPSSYDDDLVPF